MKNLTLLSKKGIISLLFVFMVILSIGDALAQTITIGSTSSTSVSTYFPLSRRALYNRCEIIYTKAEINNAGAGAGNITSISFYKYNSESSGNLTNVMVYMKHTTSTTLAAGSWNTDSTTSGYKLVYNGTNPVTNAQAPGLVTITLTTPFFYNNIDNLEIAIHHGSQSTYTTYPNWRYTSTTSNTVRYAYGSSAPTTLSTATYARPVIQMVFANSALAVNAGTDQSSCSGESKTLTATASGGTSPYNYLWSTGANTASISVSPTSTTTYTVTVTDAASTTANDNVVVNVTPSVTPSVSISANPSGTVTPGTSVTFTATPSNGGSPSYQWKKGGVNISGATSSTYTYTPVDGDVISCSMTSTASCANPTTVTSNSLTMAVRVASSLPDGTLGQTLRHDGTDWVANSLLFNNGTNVGIGTTNPSYKLDIQGNGINAGIHLRKTDGVPASWYLHPGRLGNGELSIGDDSQYRMVIDSNGNVGIGTTNPTQTFEVNGSSRLGNALNHFTYFGGGNSGYIRGTGEGYLFLASNPDGSGDKNIYLSSAANVVVTGNVGIGTTTPANKLDVQGGYIISSDVIGGEMTTKAFMEGTTDVSYFGSLGTQRASFGNNEKWETITVDGGNVGIGTTSPNNKLELYGTVSSATEGPHIRFTTTEDTYPNLQILPYYHDDVEIMFDSYWNGSYISSDLGSNAQISKGGDKLSFNYDSEVPKGAGISWNTGISMDLTNGNVGIGTTTPLAKLHIFESIDANIARDIIIGSTIAGYPNAVAKIQVQRSSSLGQGWNFLVTNNEAGTTSEAMRINSEGNVGIGTTTPDAAYKLSVLGKIRATEVIVETGWSDFVFDDNYNLKTLSEVEKFIKENKHLPDVPSASEVEKNGVSLGQSNSILLQKIEELTLYIIELKKENEKQQKQIDELKK